MVKLVSSYKLVHEYADGIPGFMRTKFRAVISDYTGLSPAQIVTELFNSELLPKQISFGILFNLDEVWYRGPMDGGDHSQVLVDDDGKRYIIFISQLYTRLEVSSWNFHESEYTLDPKQPYLKRAIFRAKISKYTGLSPKWILHQAIEKGKYPTFMEDKKYITDTWISDGVLSGSMDENIIVDFSGSTGYLLWFSQSFINIKSDGDWKDRFEILEDPDTGLKRSRFRSNIKHFSGLTKQDIMRGLVASGQYPMTIKSGDTTYSLDIPFFNILVEAGAHDLVDIDLDGGKSRALWLSTTYSSIKSDGDWKGRDEYLEDGEVGLKRSSFRSNIDKYSGMTKVGVIKALMATGQYPDTIKSGDTTYTLDKEHLKRLLDAGGEGLVDFGKEGEKARAIWHSTMYVSVKSDGDWKGRDEYLEDPELGLKRSSFRSNISKYSGMSKVGVIKALMATGQYPDTIESGDTTYTLDKEHLKRLLDGGGEGLVDFGLPGEKARAIWHSTMYASIRSDGDWKDPDTYLDGPPGTGLLRTRLRSNIKHYTGMTKPGIINSLMATGQYPDTVDVFIGRDKLTPIFKTFKLDKEFTKTLLDKGAEELVALGLPGEKSRALWHSELYTELYVDGDWKDPIEYLDITRKYRTKYRANIKYYTGMSKETILRSAMAMGEYPDEIDGFKLDKKYLKTSLDTGDVEDLVDFGKEGEKARILWVSEHYDLPGEPVEPGPKPPGGGDDKKSKGLNMNLFTLNIATIITLLVLDNNDPDDKKYIKYILGSLGIFYVYTVM